MPAQRVELSAHVTAGAAHAKIADARMTLYDHSATTGGIAIPVTFGGQGLYRATITAPKAGNYDVVFEASIEGPNLRAVRELDRRALSVPRRYFDASVIAQRNPMPWLRRPGVLLKR